ncbi:MAG: helix-turn-helix domain-containing protein [Alphaproteobacteria bacterium]|nr:helix-turn-helix domain-containing protein [Alphaproteobacteria bacterium]
MKLTPQQIASARIYLGLTQEDLARHIGRSRVTIAKIEQGESAGSSTVLEEIRIFCESQGLEFLDHEGIRRKPAGVLIFEGREGFAAFRKDVLTRASQGESDICISGVDDRLFDEWGQGEVNDSYRKAMASLPGLQCRVLTRKGDSHFSASAFAEYRWGDEGDFGDFPFYIYGKKTAMLVFEPGNVFIL